MESLNKFIKLVCVLSNMTSYNTVTKCHVLSICEGWNAVHSNRAASDSVCLVNFKHPSYIVALQSGGR